MRSSIGRRRFIKSACAAGAAAALWPSATRAQIATSEKKRNVLIFVADDQRHETIGALGDRLIQTPALDSLVKSGFSFTRAKTMGSQNGAVCIPARAMINTGRSLFRVPADMGKFTTLGQRLQAAGYTSFAAGKWHNGKPSHARSFNAGGNIFFGGMNSDQYKSPVRDFDPTGEYPDSAIHAGTKFSSELYADAVVDFLTHRGKEKPFLCYLAFTSPHDPRTPPEPFKSMYDPAKMPLPKNWLPEHPFDNGDMRGRDEMLAPFPRTEADTKKQLCDYYGMISSQDAAVARVLKTLDEQGLSENTIVIYVGDHGLAIGSHGLFGKQNIYDHSQRIPLIFRGPGIPASATSDTFVYGFDLYPTICQYLGIDPPASVEGKSLVGIISGQEKKLRESAFYAYDKLDKAHPGQSAVQRAVTDGRWKYHHYYVKGKSLIRLFDLQNDPEEIHDLAIDAAAMKELPRLRDLLKTFQHDLGDDQMKFSDT